MIIGKANRYIEDSNGNKYLTLVSTDKNKEILTKYRELWDGIKNFIKKIDSKSGGYDEKYMKIEFNQMIICL